MTSRPGQKVLFKDVVDMSEDEQKEAINNFKKETDDKIIYRADGGCISTTQWGWILKDRR